MSWSSAAGCNGKYQHSNKAQFVVFNTITPKIQNRNGIFTLPWCSRNTQCKVSFSGECLYLITQKARGWKRKDGLICVWWISGMMWCFSVSYLLHPPTFTLLYPVFLLDPWWISGLIFVNRRRTILEHSLTCPPISDHNYCERGSCIRNGCVLTNIQHFWLCAFTSLGPFLDCTQEQFVC